MWDSIRMVAYDIVLIGGALCIIIVLLLLCLRLRISYSWMQTAKTVKQGIQTVVAVVTNPIVAFSTIQSFLSRKKDPTSHTTTKTTKKKPRSKAKKITK